VPETRPERGKRDESDDQLVGNAARPHILVGDESEEPCSQDQDGCLHREPLEAGHRYAGIGRLDR
jgi:hypothetical protein